MAPAATPTSFAYFYPANSLDFLSDPLAGIGEQLSVMRLQLRGAGRVLLGEGFLTGDYLTADKGV